MITLEQIDRRGYSFVYGDRSFVENEPEQTIALFAPHVHTTYSDGIHGPEEVVYKAKALGIDAITLTDHDTNEGNLEFAEVIANYGLENYQGVEYTSFVEADNGLIMPAHMIGIKRDQGIDVPLVIPNEIIPPEEFNEEMANQNAARTGPHPTYGQDSLTLPVLERIQMNPDHSKRLTLLEIDNAAVRQAEEEVDSYGPFGWVLRKLGKAPPRGGNEAAKAVFDHLKEADDIFYPVRPIVGPDSHRDEDVGNSLVGYRVGTNPIVEAEAGRVVLLAKSADNPYSVRQLIAVKRRGRAVDKAWRSRLDKQIQNGPPIRTRV